MHIVDILLSECTRTAVDSQSKKRTLEIASQLLAKHIDEVETAHILDCLLARERLGSTSIGHGIAIPHCRLAGIDKALGALLVLKSGIPFDSGDNEFVDIIFVLVIPKDATDEHLQLLANLAEILNSKNFRDKLREATDNSTLFEVATHYHDEY